MPLGEAQAAHREAAALVSMMESAAYRGRNRPGPGPDLHRTAVMVMAHDHPAGVAREALRRFRGNACAAFEDRLPRLLRIRQHLGIDVDHYLVALPRGAGIKPLVQGRLREQGQGIGLLLGHRGRFRGDVPGARIEGCPLPAALIQALPAGAALPPPARVVL